MFSTRVVFLFITYLAVSLLSIYFYYDHDGRFRSGLLFGAFYSMWGIWLYTLYFLPIILCIIVALKKYGHGRLLINNSIIGFLILIFGAHVLYWVIAVGFKYHVYDIKNRDLGSIQRQLETIEIPRPNITYEQTPTNKYKSYIVTTEITNPLPYDVEMRLDSVKKQSTFHLLKVKLKSGETESFSASIDTDSMSKILNYYNKIWINYFLTESIDVSKFSRLVNLSHQLCVWSIFSCPNTDGIKYHNGSYPFNDHKMYSGIALGKKNGVLIEYKRDEIEALNNIK